MSNFLKIASQPTTNSGAMRAKDHTTLLANALTNHNLTIEQGEDNAIFTTQKGSYVISNDVTILAAMYQVFTDKVDLDTHLEYLSKGCLSGRMLSAKEHIESHGVKVNPIARQGKVLTAEQYLNNCVKLGLDVNNLHAVLTLINRANEITDKTTKTDLTKLVNAFVGVFVSDEQYQSYAEIVHNEEQDAKKFEGLTEAGFEHIQRSGPVIVADIPLAKAQDGTKTLLELGFNLVSNNVDMDTYTMKLVFNEEQPADL